MFLAKLVKLVHFLLLLFVVFGWLIPTQFLLWAHLVLVPSLVLQWHFNNGTCLLTNLENWLIGNKRPKTQEQGQFIKSLLAICFDPLPSDGKIKLGLYIVLLMSFSTSFCRLFT